VAPDSSPDPTQASKKEPDELLQGEPVEVWFMQAVKGLPQPLTGRLLRVGKYLIVVRTRNGQTWSLYKHCLLGLRPVRAEVRDVQQNRDRARAVAR